MHGYIDEKIQYIIFYGIYCQKILIDAGQYFDTNI